ncbi:response regulator [Rhodoblastus acidophilus]|uniref:Response regulator n=1 Tax=Candidatus Rhodoblastus alkanivorans TaxID=2954117 RepID=A0ABS9Z9L0_9HYPH|nr:response regulator [Candidatus Rhodoblastus alkanivorans]MCI4679832.1 response regulator [Candidatus Rhodoblastus alkanivorans]MCI4684338.1 response regulator [Candidatus Rhodoblastus alkanivorans]MDI4641659.1 response regulator [Rhodoblastus acidophilus]
MHNGQIVHIIEDDAGVGESLSLLLNSAGLETRLHSSAADFLHSCPPPGGCVVSDVRMPGMTGIDLLGEMKNRRMPQPVILMTAFADVPQAVRAMKLGAVDFIEKPFDDELMVSSVRAALVRRVGDTAIMAHEKLEKLTARERDVLEGLLQGKLNKTIAHDLGVSVRTVESHRANLMVKTQARSLSELIRMSLLAEGVDLEA